MRARALEGLEILDRQPAITGTAGDDHRAGTNALVTCELQDEVPLVAIARGLDTSHFIRDRHFSPELLRLIIGARHQRHTSDAGRKSQIILDPRGGPGLPSERAAIEDENGQSFRRGVDRGGQSRRPGSHDSHVIEALWIERPYHADTPGKFDLAGVAQQAAVGTEHNRQLTRVDVKALDQRLRFRIGISVERLMRMAVAPKKILEPKHITVLGVADDHRTTGSGLEQSNATQDQGAHDPLPELCLRDQQSPQPVGRDDERLHRFLRRGIDQRWPTCQLRQFTHERARTVGDD